MLEGVLFEPVVQMKFGSVLTHDRKRITSSKTCLPLGVSLSGSSRPPCLIKPTSCRIVAALPWREARK